jgi:hypothetical protein
MSIINKFNIDQKLKIIIMSTLEQNNKWQGIQVLLDNYVQQRML